MAEALMKFETIDQEQIADIMNGRPPRPPADWDDDSQPGSGDGLTTGDVPAGDPENPIGDPAGQH
jgi:cell division protease FtsH